MDPEILNCFATEKKLLILAGFYLIKPTKHRILFYISRFLNWSLNICLFISSLFLMILVKVDITVLTACWLLSITQVAFLIKLQYFYMKRFDLQNIEKFLKKEEVFNCNSEFKTKATRRNFKFCRIFFRLYRLCCTATVLGYGLHPYLDSNEEHILALPGYIPWDFVKYNLQTNILQTLTIGSSAYLNSTLDTLTVSLLTIGTVHFEVLNEKLKTLDYSQSEEIVELELRRLIMHHKTIVEFVRKVEDIFTKGLFFQFAASVGVICLTGFQLLIIEIFSTQFIMLCTYLMCMTTQVFILTWFGEVLTVKSHELIRSSYMGNWYESSPKIRKILLIFQERCKRPVIVTAAKFFSLSLRTFIVIFKSSYSYFAVLRSVYLKKLNM